MLAAQAIKAGDRQVVVAGGQESMSNAPYYDYGMRGGVKLGDQTLVDGMIKDGLWCAFCDVHMGGHAEYTAKKAGVTRETQDEFAATSHRKGGRRDRGREVQGRDRSRADRRQEGTDDRSTPTKARGRTRPPNRSRKLRPAFPGKDGRTTDLTVTAGNASSLNDGASALVVTSEEFAQRARAARSSRASTPTRPARPSREDLFFAPIHAVQNLMAKERHDHRRLRSDRGERSVRVAGARRRQGARLGLGSRQRQRRRDRARPSDRRERRARAHDAAVRACATAAPSAVSRRSASAAATPWRSASHG